MLYKTETQIWDEYVTNAYDMYFGKCKVCVLDIETTGLSADNSHFVIGGLLSIGNDGEAQFMQYFVEDLAEEKTVLAKYLEEVSKHDVVLTYNGRNFDLPFLLTRAEKLEIDVDIIPYNLDLYLVLNRYSSLRKLLPNLKQKTVEDFMGLWPYRADKISGAESAFLYRNYLLLKLNFDETEECVNLMLLHNKDDVLQLGKLLSVLEKVDLHKAMYNLGFPIIFNDKKLFVQNIKFEKNRLKVNGIQAALPVDFISYGNNDDDCRMVFKKKTGTFEVSFSLLKKNEFTILDLLKLPVSLENIFEEFPNFESEYLVFMGHNDIKYREVNYFVKQFLLKALEDIL